MQILIPIEYFSYGSSVCVIFLAFLNCKRSLRPLLNSYVTNITSCGLQAQFISGVFLRLLEFLFLF